MRHLPLVEYGRAHEERTRKGRARIEYYDPCTSGSTIVSMILGVGLVLSSSRVLYSAAACAASLLSYRRVVDVVFACTVYFVCVEFIPYRTGGMFCRACSEVPSGHLCRGPAREGVISNTTRLSSGPSRNGFHRSGVSKLLFPLVCLQPLPAPLSFLLLSLSMHLSARPCASVRSRIRHPQPCKRRRTPRAAAAPQPARGLALAMGTLQHRLALISHAVACTSPALPRASTLAPSHRCALPSVSGTRV
jgi:hypothetical protein